MSFWGGFIGKRSKGVPPGTKIEATPPPPPSKWRDEYGIMNNAPPKSVPPRPPKMRFQSLGEAVYKSTIRDREGDTFSSEMEAKLDAAMKQWQEERAKTLEAFLEVQMKLNGGSPLDYELCEEADINGNRVTWWLQRRPKKEEWARAGYRIPPEDERG